MRLLFPVIPAILLVGLILLGISDTDIAIAGTSDSSGEVASTVSKAGNSSASATVANSMTGVPDA